MENPFTLDVTANVYTTSFRSFTLDVTSKRLKFPNCHGYKHKQPPCACFYITLSGLNRCKGLEISREKKPVGVYLLAHASGDGDEISHVKPNRFGR